MISCRREYCELLEKTELGIQKQDSNHVYIKEITREMCDQ